MTAEWETIGLEQAQAHVDGKLVARMFMEFHEAFRDVYPPHVFHGLAAVGPIQALVGLAIMNGRLTAGPNQEGKEK